jgi:hypothetical protein
MKENSDPIEFLIEFAWASGADIFVVNNAKDELRKLKDNTNSEDRWLSCEKDLAKLRDEYKKLLSIFDNPVAYGLINERNDLYNLKIMDNPYNADEKVVPLYSNRQEFLTGDWKGYNIYGKFTK